MNFFIFLFIINYFASNEINGANFTLEEKLNETRYIYDIEVLSDRDPQYPIHPALLGRASSRQMSGQSMSDTELFTLLEAARWSPSTHNLQEWRFVYAKRDSKYWKAFFDVLSESNQVWVKNASALVAVVSFNHDMHHNMREANPSHSFDTGAAWMAVAVEGTSRGYVVHPLGGIDYRRGEEVIKLNTTDYTLEMFLAIGKRLPANQRTAETITQRLPLDMFVSEGVLEEKIYKDI